MQFGISLVGSRVLPAITACGLIAAAVAHLQVTQHQVTVLEKDYAQRVLGGTVCYVDQHPTCSSPYISPLKCENAVSGPNTCLDAYYHVNTTYMTTDEVYPTGGQIGRYQHNDVYCYAVTTCDPFTMMGITICQKGNQPNLEGDYLKHLQFIAEGEHCNGGGGS